MQPVSPHRWRALPTALLVIGALALGAATARAEEAPGAYAHGVSPLGGHAAYGATVGDVAASTSAAIR